MSHLICFSSTENTFPRRLSAELFSRTCRQPGEEEHEGLGSSPGSAQPGSPCRAHPTEARLRAPHSSSHLLREMPPLRSPCGNGAVLHQRLGYASATPPAFETHAVPGAYSEATGPLGCREPAGISLYKSCCSTGVCSWKQRGTVAFKHSLPLTDNRTAALLSLVHTPARNS